MFFFFAKQQNNTEKNPTPFHTYYLLDAAVFKTEEYPVVLSNNTQNT